MPLMERSEKYKRISESKVVQDLGMSCFCIERRTAMKEMDMPVKKLRFLAFMVDRMVITS